MIRKNANGWQQMVAAVYRGCVGRVNDPFVCNIRGLIWNIKMHAGTRTCSCDCRQSMREKMESVNFMDIRFGTAVKLVVDLIYGHIAYSLIKCDGHLVPFFG